MGFISNIKIKSVFKSLATIRKSKDVKESSTPRSVKVLPTAVKKTIRKHVRKITATFGAGVRSVGNTLVEHETVSSLFSVGSPVETGSGSSLEEFPPFDLAYLEGIADDNNNLANDNGAVNTLEQKVAGGTGNDTLPVSEAEWFREGKRAGEGLQHVHNPVHNNDEESLPCVTPMPESEWLRSKTRPAEKPGRMSKSTSHSSFNFLNVVDPSSFLTMDDRQETLISKCLDLEHPKDEWVRVAEGRYNQNHATRYLPTIIHENKKTLSKFIPAFSDDPDNREIFKSLKLAEIAFESLEKHFTEAGLLECVVEFLKPANHPNRTIEALQRAYRESQEFEAKFRTSQDQLHALTERGSATDIMGEARAPITVSELAELESERDKWQQQYQELKGRMDAVERDRRSLEALKESLETRAKAVSAQSDRMWQRQKEQHNFFTKHHEEGTRVAQDITNKMYQELATEHAHLRSTFVQAPIQLAKAISEKVALEQQLEAEKTKSSTSEVEEIKAQLEALRMEHEKATFLNEIQDSERNAEIADLKSQLQETEWLRLLTPEQIREAALIHAFHEVEDYKRLYADSCFENSRLRHELSLAHQYGLELGVIADQADRLHGRRLPETITLPTREENVPISETVGQEGHDKEAKEAAERAAEDNSFHWTDDSEIF